MNFYRFPRLLGFVAILGTLATTTRAFAYELWDPAGSCTTTRWQATPRIELRWTLNVGLSAGDVDIVQQSIAQLNELPNAKLYFYIGEDFCDDLIHVPPDNVICIGGVPQAPCGDTLADGCHKPGPTGTTNCTRKACTVELLAGISPKRLWVAAVHEVAHCLGVDHPEDNPFDWMNASGDYHVGMTRDTMNALNFLYPFSQSFLFGDFNVSSSNDTDILTRDNQASSNTIPWCLTTQHSFNDAWIDSGQVISDFGNETTLAYLSGDFNGDNCTDVVRALCDGCNPGDGAGDTVEWSVRTSNCGSSFNAASVWRADFGNAEDFDQHRVGDFDGDGCDDIWLIRNTGAYNCTGSNCGVEFWWLLARRPNGASCASSGSAPDRFVVHGPDTLSSSLVTDRSAAVAWPWVVGDIETTDGLGCADLAFGRGDQTDPRTLEWRVYRAKDTNSDGLCDGLVSDGGDWAANWGALGLRHVFAAQAGHSAAEDIITVTLPIIDGVQEARWSVGYSNGNDDLFDVHTPVQDHRVTGVEVHWTGKVFGIGNFDSLNGDFVDFITLRGAGTTGSVSARVAYRSTGTGAWSLSQLGNDTQLPTAVAAWNQPTDEDFDNVKDNGGDDAKDAWWCQDCDTWYCETCSGCCP